MHTVPLTPAYTYSTSVPTGEVPRTKRAIDMLLVRHIASPLAARLVEDGYQADDLNLIMEGSKVTVDTTTEPGHAIFLLTFPHPGGQHEGELHPLMGIPVELIGGERDGHRPPMRPGHHETIAYATAGSKPGEHSAVYWRTGYNLETGFWAYQLQKQTASDTAGA